MPIMKLKCLDVGRVYTYLDGVYIYLMPQVHGIHYNPSDFEAVYQILIDLWK